MSIIGGSTVIIIYTGARIILSVNDAIVVSESSGQLSITVTLDAISDGLERDVVVDVAVELLTTGKEQQIHK